MGTEPDRNIKPDVSSILGSAQLMKVDHRDAGLERAARIKTFKETLSGYPFTSDDVISLYEAALLEKEAVEQELIHSREREALIEYAGTLGVINAAMFTRLQFLSGENDRLAIEVGTRRKKARRDAESIDKLQQTQSDHERALAEAHQLLRRQEEELEELHTKISNLQKAENERAAQQRSNGHKENFRADSRRTHTTRDDDYRDDVSITSSSRRSHHSTHNAARNHDHRGHDSSSRRSHEFREHGRDGGIRGAAHSRDRLPPRPGRSRSRSPARRAEHLETSDQRDRRRRTPPLSKTDEEAEGNKRDSEGIHLPRDDEKAAEDTSSGRRGERRPSNVKDRDAGKNGLYGRLGLPLSGGARPQVRQGQPSVR